MKTHPPVFATRLLESFVNQNPALVGDLVEEYRTGRSALWYWRQVATAIVVSSSGSIRDHKWLALRALAVGWIFGVGVSRLAAPFMRRSFMSLFDAGIISRTLWSNAYVITMLWTGFVICLTASWLVARTHRPYSRAMVLLLLVSILVSWIPSAPWFFRLFRDTFDNSRYIPSFLLLLSRYLLAIFGTLLGGILGAGPSSTSPVPSTAAHK